MREDRDSDIENAENGAMVEFSFTPLGYIRIQSQI
jgi:hypothetical protein